MDNPLWRYSLDVYTRAGVAAQLLRLQDEFVLDINLLLYAAWLGSKGMALSRSQLAAVEAATAEWRRDVIEPLRRLRRGLREIEQAQSVRDSLKALELEAEERQQRLIFVSHSAADLPSGAGNALDNLCLVASSAGVKGRECLSLLERLAPLLAP